MAPTPLADGASEGEISASQKTLLKFTEKNGKLCSVLGWPGGTFQPDCSQVVQSSGTRDLVSVVVRSYIALEQKYRVEGMFRMQQLHDELASIEVTAAEKYDPARAIQQLRRIFHGLGSLATE